MKNPEDYLEYYFDFTDVRESDLIQMINEIKKDAYNQAIDDAIANVEIEPMNGMSIIKESILKLKIK